MNLLKFDIPVEFFAKICVFKRSLNQSSKHNGNLFLVKQLSLLDMIMSYKCNKLGFSNVFKQQVSKSIWPCYRVCNTLVSNIIQTVRDYNLIHEDNLLSKKRHSSTDGIIIITYKLHQRIPFYTETIHKK